jgi:hypothetical protein
VPGIAGNSFVLSVGSCSSAVVLRVSSEMSVVVVVVVAVQGAAHTSHPFGVRAFIT